MSTWFLSTTIFPPFHPHSFLLRNAAYVLDLPLSPQQLPNALFCMTARPRRVYYTSTSHERDFAVKQRMLPLLIELSEAAIAVVGAAPRSGANTFDYTYRVPASDSICAEVVRGAAKRRYRFDCTYRVPASDELGFGRRQANAALQTSSSEYFRRFASLLLSSARHCAAKRRYCVDWTFRRPASGYLDFVVYGNSFMTSAMVTVVSKFDFRVPARGLQYIIQNFSAARQSSSTSTLQIKIPYFAVRRAKPPAFQPYVPRSILRDFSLTFELQKLFFPLRGLLHHRQHTNWKFDIRCPRERGFVSRGTQRFFSSAARRSMIKAQQTHQIGQVHEGEAVFSSLRGSFD
ncbi:hypothetical protein R3P38DRAFT_3236941 [Favolaschia claudopus]|uniref:Uncharacterized protein n=1 Tax=Favolaschia claudopus TaxID=2862362 RepID=A0AAV9ZCE9_9AGAR